MAYEYEKIAASTTVIATINIVAIKGKTASSYSL